MNRDEFRVRLAGPIPSIRTPFLRGGEVDFTGLRNQVEFCLQAGAGALMLTMGDSHLICLSDEEIAEVTRVTCEQARGRALVIAADRYFDTSRSVAFARYAKSVGADLIMCAPPDWGHSCTPDSLAEHFAAVARELPVNLVTGVFIPRGAAFALATIRKAFDRSERVVAIKDDFCGDFAQKLCLAEGRRAAIYAGGMKQNHLSMWAFGGVCGYLASFITFKPAVTHAYWRAIQANDLPAARRIIRDIDNPWLDHLMTYPGGFDAPMHGLGEIFGIAQRWRRPPYTSLTDAEMERLRDFMAKLPEA